MSERETFSSRLGFIMISAGCAIGLGNVWRFPYVTGKYGGAVFVLFYLFFLGVLGLPIMVMEFSVGRASRKSAGRSFHVLEPAGTKWHIFSHFAIISNYLLLMFYTTVGGWMLSYFFKTLKGDFQGLNPEAVSNSFSLMLANPGTQVFWMVITVLISLAVCARGLQNGVEKITKIMMFCLLSLMLILVFRAVTLPGAAKGLTFYLKPDFSKIIHTGLTEVLFAAMGQAFFTLSIGIGSMAIFGSYIDRSHSLTGEAINVILLDTFVALMAGLIIFPSCAAFNVNPGQGPGLIFITLPNIFNHMSGGRLWGSLFFIFMSFAALSTIIAVSENIISFAMDLWNWDRKKAVVFNLFALIILSLPCALGFNILKGINIPRIGSSIQDIEDFLVSNNLLPLGSLIYVLFCTARNGWGFDNFLEEANQGKGILFPRRLRGYMTWILPAVILGIWIAGYIQKFAM